MFFLTKFNFINKDQLYFYSIIWQETFCPIPLRDINIVENNYIMFLDNNDLKIVCKGKENIIKNINNYSSKLLDTLRWNISLFNNIPDLYELDKYLKFDKYDSNLFIKSHWIVLSDYIAEIICSDTIQNIYKEIYHINIVISDKNQVKKILDNLRFFNYETGFIAETKKIFLSIYIESNLQNGYPNNIDLIKLIYLTVFLITCIHEIIGHLFLRISNYSIEGKKMESPKPFNPSEYAAIRGKESGEKIEEMLFGNYKFEMTIKEMLFTLNKENYKISNLSFKERFSQINNQKLVLSDDLKKLLELYKIDVSKIDFNLPIKYSVNKTKNKEKIKFPNHHSIKSLRLKLKDN